MRLIGSTSSLKFKLIANSAGILSICFMAIALFNYFQRRSKLERTLFEETIPSYINNINYSIDQRINKSVNFTEFFVKNSFVHQWIQGEQNHEVMYEYLKMAHESINKNVAFVVKNPQKILSNNFIERHLSPEQIAYYWKEIDAGKSFYTAVNSDTDGQLKLWIVRKVIEENGKVTGAIALDLDFDEILESILSHQLSENSQLMLVDKYGSIKVHSDSTLLDLHNLEVGSESKRVFDLKEYQGLSEDILQKDTIQKYEDSDGKQRLIVSRYVSTMDLYLLSDVSESELYASLDNKLIQTFVLGLGSFLLILFINYLVVQRIIFNPLEKMHQGVIALSEGDLSHPIEINQTHELGKLAQTMNLMREQFSELIQGIQMSVSYILQMSEEISNSSQNLSVSTNEQASNVEEISASMEQMHVNVSQNANNANLTNEISKDLKIGLEEMGTLTRKSNESVMEISEKITIINEIAYQTNLLALNAAVEAARAGEHGKGFAVVAAEIRKLAQNSKEAAEKIGKLSNSSIELTKNSDEFFKNMGPEIGKTSVLISEINTASGEQSQGIEQINSALLQLNQITQQNAAASEQMASSAKLFIQQAKNLEHDIQQFKVS